MNTKLNWGILGTGAIAKAFAHGLQLSTSGRLLAVASRTRAAADAFGDVFSLARRYPSYEALLADRDIDVIYIATPHPFHAEWSIRAAEAGKHILCEKPAGLNLGEAMVAIEAARRTGVFWMEAFMYRCHAQTWRLVQVIHEGAIGDVRSIHGAFSFEGSTRPGNRLFDNALGGGAILDIGCYPVSMARLIAGAARRKPFEEPTEILATGIVGGDTQVDEQAATILRFPDAVMAQVSTGLRFREENVIRIFGTAGWIHVPAPWQPAKHGEDWFFTIHRADPEATETVRGTEPRNIYAVEADHVAAHLDQHEASPPGMTWADTMGNMRTLDRWREQVQVSYAQEKPEHDNRRESLWLKPAPPSIPMKLACIPGSGVNISRLVMGVDNQRDYPHAAAMFDDFVGKGGNAFDTAWIYGNGTCERLLGHWMRNRGNRDKLVVIGKGAHPPFCDPEGMTRQFKESLDRLQTDHVDLYLLHRDNPDVPAGEFVDVLNRHLAAGTIRGLGASNWAITRVEEANRYASEHGLEGFSVLSNNLSLARMVEPPWPGCASASDPDSRAWLEAHQFPLLAWSSQAHGFFTDRAHLDEMSDTGPVRAWHSADNFKRRERAIELARRHRVLPVNIALAYVLNLPFPTLAIIGPRTLDETRMTLPALQVSLSAKEMRYLALED